MKVLISDYAELMNDTAQKEKHYLLKKHPEWEVEIYPYSNNQEELIKKLNGAEVLLTAFLPLNQEILEKMYTTKCISIDATGYSTVDLAMATKKGIGVLAIDEYCTFEVAEHTMSLIMALSRGIKNYIREIEENYKWHYETAGKLKRLNGQKIGIFGFGRIGQRVAMLARSFGMEVYVYHDIAYPITDKQDVHLADIDEICDQCSIITNHMSQTKDNKYFFNKDFFSKLKQAPIFINVGRGEAVEEKALVWALKAGILNGAALDVLETENPDLRNCRLLNRDNVIITPHAAFYSSESIEALSRISANNIIYYMSQAYDKVNKLVNPEVLHLRKEGN